MLEIFGNKYYIDIDAITEKCDIQNKTIVDENGEGEEMPAINIFKYEIVKLCLDRILVEFDNEDDGDDFIHRGSNESNSFKFAFNTLINYEIIKEKEDE